MTILLLKSLVVVEALRHAPLDILIKVLRKNWMVVAVLVAVVLVGVLGNVWGVRIGYNIHLQEDVLYLMSIGHFRVVVAQIRGVGSVFV
jgi:hypothetical protein